MDTNNNIPESFETFLATGSSIIQTCRELMAENQRLRLVQHDYEQVFKDHGIMSADNLRLYLEDYAAIQKVMEKHELNDDADLGFVLENYDKFKDIASDLGCVQSCDPDELRSKVEALKNNGSSDPPADYQTLKDFKGEMDAIHEEFDILKDVSALRGVLSDWKDMKEACDSNRVEPDELNEKLEELDAIKDVMDNKDISDADDLDNYLDEVADFQKYKKGFEELSEFVDNVKEAVEEIPSTDIEDYD